MDPSTLTLDNTVGSAWTITPATDGTYSISNNGLYLDAGENHSDFATDNIYTHNHASDYYLTASTTPADGWQLVSEKERMELLADPDFSDINKGFDSWLVDINGGTNNIDGDTDADNSRGNRVYNSGSSSSIDMSTSLTDMPAGTYILSLQGFYRDGLNGDVVGKRESGTEVVRSFYYINNVEAPLMSVLDDAKSAKETNFDKDGGSGYFFPSGAKAAARAFNSDYAYVNNPISTFVEDGEVTIGIRKNGLPSATKDFTAFDNFRLLYAGDARLGVNNICNDTLNDKIYNINGVEVKNMNAKGIYIVNGRKIIK